MDETYGRGLFPYDRAAAVRYARRWAYGRNPAFYDYEQIGGDCTNFASQCVYAGSGVMNFEKDFGWYYVDANNKAPAWTGVEYFYRFMTREAQNPGPVAINASISQLELGDVVQLSFDGESWNHSPVVVRLLRRPALRPADDQGIRFLHFIGVRR